MNDRNKTHRKFRRKPKSVRTTPTQQQTFTLSDGRVLPNPINNKSSIQENWDVLPESVTIPNLTSNSRTIDFITLCENNMGDFYFYDNPTYEQAGMCYNAPNLMNFHMVVGTIYIDGIPSTNPEACVSIEQWPFPPDDCIVPFNHMDNWQGGSFNCEYPCNSEADCPDLPWPGATNCMIDCTGNCIPTEDCAGQGFCRFIDNTYFPNYGMYGYSNATGNTDFIAAIHNTPDGPLVVGGDFVNNMLLGDPWLNEQIPVDGIVIPIQQYEVSLGVPPGYPNYGERIDDLILYRASTGTYHRLTYQSYQDYFQNSWTLGDDHGPLPMGYGNMSILENDLHFESEETTILPGDTNVDGTLNVLDVVVLVNSILAGADNDALMNSFPQADMDGDGYINVVDIVQMIQLILNNPTTSSRDRQELQKQLDRLGGGTQRGGNVGRNTQRNRKFRRRRR